MSRFVLNTPVNSNHIKLVRQSGATWRKSANNSDFAFDDCSGHIPLRYPGRRPGLRPVASWNLAYRTLSSSVAAS